MKLVLAMCLSMPMAAPCLARQDAFPTGKTITIKEDGKRWAVDGRTTIANSVSVVSLRSARIDGLSKDQENVIVVSGALEFKAVTGGRVQFDNVWIELAPDAKSLYLSQCEFRGGGVRMSKQAATAPKIFMEFVDFTAGASLSLNMKAGSVELQASSSVAPVIFNGAQFSEKSPNKANVSILSCSGAKRGLHGGLEITGIAIVQVRHSELAGATTRIADCPKLEFDGNTVRSAKLQFVQAIWGSFGATKVHNCDFHTSKIEFRTPAPEKKLEHLTLDHCWFNGLTKPEDITKSMIVDNTTDPTSGVVIAYTKTSAVALRLSGDSSR